MQNTLEMSFPTNSDARGIPPNPPGAFAAYSSPMIQLPDGSYVMDSQLIAVKLESLYPESSLHLDVSPYQKAAEVSMKILFAVVGNFMAPVVDEWLEEPSKSWFEKDRSKRLGMTVWELRDQKGGEQVFANAEPSLKELKELLHSHKMDEGPFVLGSKVSYADLVVIGFLESLERVEKGTYDRIVAFDESFKKLHEAGKKWTERDGH